MRIFMVTQALEDRAVNARAVIHKTSTDILEALDKGLIICKKDLVDGAFYYGSCRNARVAKWNASKNCFEYIRTKYGDRFWETINHPEDDNQYDLFVPVLKLDDDYDRLSTTWHGEEYVHNFKEI